MPLKRIESESADAQFHATPQVPTGTRPHSSRGIVWVALRPNAGLCAFDARHRPSMDRRAVERQQASFFSSCVPADRDTNVHSGSRTRAGGRAGTRSIRSLSSYRGDCPLPDAPSSRSSWRRGAKVRGRRRGAQNVTTLTTRLEDSPSRRDLQLASIAVDDGVLSQRGRRSR